MTLRLTCNRFMRAAAAASGRSTTTTIGLRSFGAAAETPEVGAPAPSIFDKIISLTIVDPSGARRKINGVVGE